MNFNNYRDEYIRVMKKVDVDESVKQQIVRNCARYSTLTKIKAVKFKVTAIKKDGVFKNS